MSHSSDLPPFRKRTAGKASFTRREFLRVVGAQAGFSSGLALAGGMPFFRGSSTAWLAKPEQTNPALFEQIAAA